MKRGISFLLIIFVLLNTCSNMIIYHEFTLHREYFAQNFCINKNNPSLHCLGSCHLKKMLGKENKKQNNSGTAEKNIQDFIGLPLNLSSTCCKTFSSFVNIQSKSVFNLLQGFMFLIFHPPSK